MNLYKCRAEILKIGDSGYYLLLFAKISHEINSIFTKKGPTPGTPSTPPMGSVTAAEHPY